MPNPKLTKPSLQSIPIPYRLLMAILLFVSLIMIFSFDSLSDKNEHNAKVVFNGEINHEAKILRKAEDLPLLLNRWIELSKLEDDFEQIALISQIESSVYLSNTMKPVLILDPYPQSSAPILSKIYLVIFQLPENKSVQERPSFDKLPEIIDHWNCSFKGSIKSKKEFFTFEINKQNLDKFVAIPYGTQYESDLYWLLSNNELVYGQF